MCNVRTSQSSLYRVISCTARGGTSGRHRGQIDRLCGTVSDKIIIIMINYGKNNGNNGNDGVVWCCVALIQPSIRNGKRIFFYNNAKVMLIFISLPIFRFNHYFNHYRHAFMSLLSLYYHYNHYHYYFYFLHYHYHHYSSHLFFVFIASVGVALASPLAASSSLSASVSAFTALRNIASRAVRERERVSERL